MTKNSKLSLFAAIPAFIVLFIVRLMLIAGGTDFDHGFYYDENGALANFSYYGLLIITFVVLLALNITDKKKGSLYHTNAVSQMVDSKAVMLGFPLFVAGALVMYEGYLQTTSLTPSAYLIFVNFVMGAAITIVGFVILFKKEITPAVGFSLIVPALYYTMRGIGVFLERMAVTTIPEYLIDCLSVIGAALFFMQLAKLMTGNESKTTRPIVLSAGLTTALMILSNAFAVIAADVLYPEGAGSRIAANFVIAQTEQQKLLSQFTYGYHMAYTSWADVVIAAGIILAVIALGMKPAPEADADAAASEQESPAETE